MVLWTSHEALSEKSWKVLPAFLVSYLRCLFENFENLVTKSSHYGIIEKKYVLENTHGDNNGW